MQSTTQGKFNQEQARREMGLGRCLVEGDPEAASNARCTRRKTFGVSLAIEILMLGLLLAAPLLSSTAHPQIHQILPPQLTFFGAWREHSQNQHMAAATSVRTPEIQNPFAPTPTADMTIRTLHSDETEDVPILDLSGGEAAEAVLITGIASTTTPIEPPHIAQPAQQEKRSLKLSEGVLEAQLISRIEPHYPSLAKQTRTEGTVRLHAIIGRDGRIASLEVISGHPLLVQAALDAVRRWSYRPTMLNGQPVDVETSITIVFKLHE
jgi:protein TonB